MTPAAGSGGGGEGYRPIIINTSYNKNTFHEKDSYIFTISDKNPKLIAERTIFTGTKVVKKGGKWL